MGVSGERMESSGGYAVVVVQVGGAISYSIRNAENTGKTRSIMATELECIAKDLRRMQNQELGSRLHSFNHAEN